MGSIVLPAQGWRPRSYQLPLWKYMEPQKRGQRAVIAWHRRAGKDLTCINICATKSVQRVGLYWLVYPYLNQGRRIAWNGMDADGKKFLDAWPKGLIERRHDGDMRLYLRNGSIIQVMGADHPDRAVGTNPVGVVFSEMSLCDPLIWQLITPILAENGGWAIFNGTPRGENHFYDLKQEAEANKAWFCSHLSVKDTRVVSPQALREARAELKDEALFQQEFMTSFASPLQGAYYDSQMKMLAREKRFIDTISADPKLEVHTAWDLGMDDSTSIWFYQTFGTEIRLLDYYENSGEGLPFYVRHLRQWAVDNGVTYGRHFFPHDVKVREMNNGKSRFETLRELGVKVNVVKKHTVFDGIEASRNLLPRCWFSRHRCHRGINALKSYRKEWDALRNTFKTSPVHDWASHAADAFRILAWGFRDEKKQEESRSRQNREYQREYEIFA